MQIIRLIPFAGAALVLGATSSPSPPANAAPQPYSVQMHVHGSPSEGKGSMESGTWEAEQMGLDAIWWSDHDWRASHYRSVSRFGFENFTEDLGDGEPWAPMFDLELGHKGFLLDPKGVPPTFTLASMVVDSATPPDTGQASFQLQASNSASDWASFKGNFGASRGRARRFLASGIQLEMAILPDTLSADARPFVDITLSQHLVPGEAVAYDNVVLHYFLNNSGTTPWRDGFTYYIPVPYTKGQWNHFLFDLNADVGAGFPNSHPGDNSLRTISIGIESKNDALCIANYDSMIIHDGAAGPELFKRQARILELLENLKPQVAQLQGAEISYLRHLNEFSLSAQIPDYERYITESGYMDANGWVADTEAMKDVVVQRIVNDIHLRGGVVSYNHLFGTEGSPNPDTKEQILADLIANNLFSTDILEVGYRERAYRPLEDFLWVWDQLALNGIPLIGNGVSDSHGNGGVNDWQSRKNNFVSWIYADSPSKPDLLEGLKAGRIFFGDKTQFDGTVELTTPEQFDMGKIIVTDKTLQGLRFRVDGLVAGDEVKIISNGIPVRTHTAQSSIYNRAVPVPLPTMTDNFFRIEVRSSQGVEKVFSNPIWFVREVPARGVSASQFGMDLGGILSEKAKNMRIRNVLNSPFVGGGILFITGAAKNGELTLEFPAATMPWKVRYLNGISGNHQINGTRLTVYNLQGIGTIAINY